jgi:hypothetical protein
MVSAMFHDMRCQLLASLAACFAAGAVQAAEFSWEPSGVANEVEQDSVDADRLSFGLTYYFDSVDDTRGPLALAAFIDPATRISVSFDRAKGSVPDPQAPFTFPVFSTGDATTDEYSVAGRYVLPASKWYFGGGYTHGDGDPPPRFTPIDGDIEGYGLVVGKYLGADTTLELAFDSSDVRTDLNPSCTVAPCSVQAIETQSDAWSIAAQHVWRGGPVAYSLWGRFARTEASVAFETALPPSTVESDFRPWDQYSVAGEIFPTQKLGFRVGYSWWDGKNGPSVDVYDLSATWFATHKVGIALTFSQQRMRSGSFYDNDATALRIVGRF